LRYVPCARFSAVGFEVDTRFLGANPDHVGGWRFFYKVDADNGRLVVTSASPAPRELDAREFAKA
jgi:hypothetical protein